MSQAPWQPLPPSSYMTFQPASAFGQQPMPAFPQQPSSAQYAFGQQLLPAFPQQPVPPFMQQPAPPFAPWQLLALPQQQLSQQMSQVQSGSLVGGSMQPGEGLDPDHPKKKRRAPVHGNPGGLGVSKKCSFCKDLGVLRLKSDCMEHKGWPRGSSSNAGVL
jgi:hypothetical protein